MKTCKGCRHAEWKRTANGKLHPDGSGKCIYEWRMPPLPACKSWWSFPFALTTSIDRKKDLLIHCPCWEQESK